MSLFLHNLDISNLNKTRRTAAIKFPAKLHQILNEVEQKGNDEIISWNPDGKSFNVHNQKTFVDSVLPSYFRHSKYRSFQRQLNLYGFERVPCGPLDGSYHHPDFFRDNANLCKNITRRETSAVNRKEFPRRLRLTANRDESDPTTESLVPISDSSFSATTTSSLSDHDRSSECDTTLIDESSDINSLQEGGTALIRGSSSYQELCSLIVALDDKNDFDMALDISLVFDEEPCFSYD
jgi:hypothetical protein